MKKLTLLFAFILTFAVFANAQTQKQIRADIPFDFYLQNQKMTAGEYSIESVSKTNYSTLIFRDKNGKAKGSLTTLVDFTNNLTVSFDAKMTFNRYGNTYFLTEIRNPLENAVFSVKANKTERNLSKTTEKSNQETLAITFSEN